MVVCGVPIHTCHSAHTFISHTEVYSGKCKGVCHQSANLMSWRKNKFRDLSFFSYIKGENHKYDVN